MFFLRSIFRMREHINESRANGEMSFLEHLEDLRRTALRICATVLVAMIACFAFTPHLLELLRKPVENVWVVHERAHLPSSVNELDWLAAKDLDLVRRSLDATTREKLEKRLSPEALKLAEALPLLRAADLLPEAEREAFLQEAVPQGEVGRITLELYESGADLSEGRGQASPQIMGAFQPGEAFMLSVQLAFFGGLIVSAPLVLYFILQFVAPGLREHEKRILYKSVGWGMGLFLAGCAFAYYAVLPRVLSFFFEYSWDMGIANDWRIGYYLTFAAKLILVFGVIFELPVIIIPLIKLGILTYERMRRSRTYAIVGSFGIALLLAPAPDPGTMLIMAMPLYMLYELCILVAWREMRKQTRAYG